MTLNRGIYSIADLILLYFLISYYLNSNQIFLYRIDCTYQTRLISQVETNLRQILLHIL